MLFWVLIILLLNGMISFVYTALTTTNTINLWAMLAVNFVFFLGITQTGIVFSAIMRISKSGWGRHFSRFGEILTLSFIPVAVITFIIIYIGGVDHLFYWAHPVVSEEHSGGHQLSPWLNKNFFLWRYILTVPLFYIMSYIYFRTGRKEENDANVSDDLTKKLNVYASFVMGLYIVVNTNIAWDFGMMIIPHWESSIFPPYYWAGNLLAGTAFLFAASLYFIPKKQGEGIDTWRLESVGSLLMGFALLSVYLFWSQHIVIWYGNLPNLTVPLFKKMTGNYTTTFVVMMLAIFAIPFLSLLFRPIKLCAVSLTVVAVIICIGMWINRYLMILPVFTDGSVPVAATWTGISLILAGLAATLLSIISFLKLFPTITTTVRQVSE